MLQIIKPAGLFIVDFSRQIFQEEMEPLSLKLGTIATSPGNFPQRSDGVGQTGVRGQSFKPLGYSPGHLTVFTVARSPKNKARFKEAIAVALNLSGGKIKQVS